jgi:hypothetical protein
LIGNKDSVSRWHPVARVSVRRASFEGSTRERV